MVQRAQQQDLGAAQAYRVAFGLNARGEVVTDRRFNTGGGCRGVGGWGAPRARGADHPHHTQSNNASPPPPHPTLPPASAAYMLQMYTGSPAEELAARIAWDRDNPNLLSMTLPGGLQVRGCRPVCVCVCL